MTLVAHAATLHFVNNITLTATASVVTTVAVTIVPVSNFSVYTLSAVLLASSV